MAITVGVSSCTIFSYWGPQKRSPHLATSKNTTSPSEVQLREAAADHGHVAA